MLMNYTVLFSFNISHCYYNVVITIVMCRHVGVKKIADCKVTVTSPGRHLSANHNTACLQHYETVQC